MSGMLQVYFSSGTHRLNVLMLGLLSLLTTPRCKLAIFGAVFPVVGFFDCAVPLQECTLMRMINKGHTAGT